MTLRDRLATASADSRERILDALGLEPKPAPSDYILPALGLFGAGLICGAVIGLLVAPKPGVELRHDIRDRVSEGTAAVRRRLHRGEEEQE